jgi:hypothetical protein
MYHYRFEKLLFNYKVSIYLNEQFVMDCPVWQCHEDFPEDQWVSFDNTDECREYSERHKNKRVSKEVLLRFGIVKEAKEKEEEGE